MISQDLVNTLQQLNRTEKLQVIQLLAHELQDTLDTTFSGNSEYEAWSPFDAPDAANILLQMLDKNQG
ncbi:MAG: hypothetical protein ACOYL5_09530 [Phototrophicaceae bacterium]|jgi:hypothetical protein